MQLEQNIFVDALVTKLVPTCEICRERCLYDLFQLPCFLYKKTYKKQLFVFDNLWTFVAYLSFL